MTRRVLAITIAIVLATLGTVGGLVLVLSAENRAENRISNPVTVAVASMSIPVGTTGEQIRTKGMVRLVKMPQASVPDDVMGEISPELDSMVTTSNIAAGQILLRAQFGSHASVTSGLALPVGTMAVTVETGAPEAGYVQAGSEVAIFVTYSVVKTNGDKTGIERTRVLLPRVTVLAVGTRGQQSRSGSTANASSGSGSNHLILTVAVTPEDAARLIEALSHGTLYLGLLNDSVTVNPGTGVDNTDGGGGSPLFP